MITGWGFQQRHKLVQVLTACCAAVLPLSTGNTEEPGKLTAENQISLSVASTPSFSPSQQSSEDLLLPAWLIQRLGTAGQ